jgi:hypothetical protein
MSDEFGSIWKSGRGLLEMLSRHLSGGTQKICAKLKYRAESESLYGFWFTANQFALATSPLRPKTRIFIFKLNTCGYSSYTTSCLTRGWVWCLQVFLALASAVIIRSQSRRTHEHFLLSRIRDSRTWSSRFPYLYTPPPRNRVVRLYPQALGFLFFASYDSQAFDTAPTRESVGHFSRTYIVIIQEFVTLFGPDSLLSILNEHLNFIFTI